MIGLREKEMMNEAKAGSFSAAMEYAQRSSSLSGMVGALHPLGDVEAWQFDVYADAWRTAQELRDLST